MRDQFENGKELGRFLDERLPAALGVLIVMLICAVMVLSMGCGRFIKSMTSMGVHALRVTHQPWPDEEPFVVLVDQLHRVTENQAGRE